MKLKHHFVILLLLFALQSRSQEYPYEPSASFPYGRMNPEAPGQLKDFEPMIGKCSCKSVSRINQTTWGDTVQMTWTFKYIMNGLAIQDETLKTDGAHSGSIRQFNSDSSKWHVHYYSSSTTPATLSSWEGNKVQDKILLYRAQKAPNGFDGFYKITFYNMDDSGYDWLGEWVNADETIRYPTWKIFCQKLSNN